MAKAWNPDRRGKRVAVNISTATTTELVAADAAKRYRLLRYTLTEKAGTATLLTFKSATTAILGGREIAANSGMAETLVGGENCTLGEALNLTTDAAGEITGDVWYEEI